MGALREIAEAGLAAFNAGQLEQVAQFYTDDAVLISARGTFTGREAILGVLRDQVTAAPDRQMKMVRCTEEGDTVVVEYQFTGTHTGPWPMPNGTQLPPTGRQLDVTGAAAYSMTDGRITEHRDYSDRLIMLMQLGLFPTT